MVASDLVHRVTIQNGTETSDGHDGLVMDWANTTQLRVPALVKPLAGRDREYARQIHPLASHEVVLWFWNDYATDLDGGRARFVWHDDPVGDRTLEIVEPPRETLYHTVLAMVCREMQ